MKKKANRLDAIKMIISSKDVSSQEELLQASGFVSLQFSGNIAVIRTRPGYASSMAYDIDNRECPAILGTIAGDDTIMLVVHEAASHGEVREFLSQIIPNIK